MGAGAPAERRTGESRHGQAWATKRIEEGDQTCKANQALHGEATNLVNKIKANSTYNPAVADPLDPVTFVKKIDVPTFMACQWEDEQTGGHCADLAEHFTGTTRKWFTFTNGAHIDSLDPYTASDEEAMPAGQFVPVTIPLYFEGHAYRAGSRIRVTIAAPNGTQPVWSFGQTQPEGGTATESIAFSPSMPSSLTLPIVPGISVPTALPAGASLRNEPCRAYQAFVNGGS